jgi:Flp pilus assembly protein TadG
MNPWKRLRRDEGGMSILYVTTGFLAFFVATTLAIDVGMLTTARAQAQNAADSGALAGAVALALDSFDDRSASGPAVQSAINAARENLVIGGEVSVGPADVEFPVAPSGESNRVKVTVHRTSARSNPLSTFIASVFGMDTADMIATATAHAAPANAMTCVRPFTISDKWIENNIPPNETFDRYDKKGDVIKNADVYSPGTTSYKPGTSISSGGDKGRRVTLRAAKDDSIAPSFYFSWKMPGGTGADFYEENITGCNQAIVETGDWITQEPGAMSGPTTKGLDDLIAQDPMAYWDEDDERVVSPMGRSPRVFPIPLYDPDVYQSGKMTGRTATLTVSGWIGFFLEGRDGIGAYGRIVPMLGIIDEGAGPVPVGAFPRAVQLVE